MRGLPTFAHERGVQESVHAVVDALELRFDRALLLGKISHMYHGQPGRRDKAAMIRLRRRMSQAHNLQDVESLRTAMHAGWRPSFLYFWGHTPKDANVGKHVLSQWWPASFEVDGQAYPTAEHYMMAEKARLFGDAKTRAEILATTDPAQAKALGRKVRGFDEERWAGPRVSIAVRGTPQSSARTPT